MAENNDAFTLKLFLAIAQFHQMIFCPNKFRGIFAYTISKNRIVD